MTQPTEKILSRDFVLLCVSATAFFSSFTILFAALPLYLRDLGGTDFHVGLVMGVFAFAALVPRPFVGREIDRGGSKRFMIAGSLFFLTAALLYLPTTSVGAVLGVRVVHGIGMALYTTAGFAVIADLAPPSRRGEAMGIWGVVPPVASAIAPVLGLTIRNRAGDDAVFLTSAVLSALSLLLILFLREPARTRAPGLPASGLFERSVLFPSVLVIAMAWLFGAVSSFVILFSEERSISHAGFFFTANTAAVLLTRVFGGKLSDRHGRWVLIVPSLGMLGLGAVLLSQVDSFAGLMVASVTLGSAYGLGYPALSALAVDLAPVEKRGAGMATFTSAFEIGIGGGAIIMGFVAANAGYSSMFLLAATIPVAGMVAALIVNRGLRREVVVRDSQGVAD